MKYVLKFLVVVLLASYLIYVFVAISGKRSEDVCQTVDVIIADSQRVGFITPEVVENILKRAKLTPIGKNMDDINGNEIETQLKKNSFINNAVCYKSPGGRLGIIIEQRLPIMRIMSNDGDNYYIDGGGNSMPHSGYCADLVVATGHITRSFASKELLKIGLFLKYDDFWNNQIEQIDVQQDGTIDFVSRVGGQIIHIGNANNLEQKLNNMMAFYEKVIPTVGWNKYTRFNVEHTNQVICTIQEAN